MYHLLVLAAILVSVSSQRRFDDDDIGIYDGHLYGIHDIHHHNYRDLRHGLGITGGIGGIGGVGGIGGRLRIGNGRNLRPCQRRACTRQLIPPSCRYTPVFRDESGRYCSGCPEDICTGGRPLGRGGFGGRGNGRGGRGGRGNGRGGRGGRSGRGGRGGRGNGRESERRLRRIQRRICRSSGMCFGEGLGGVAGVGGIGVGGIGVVGGGVVGGGLGGLGGLGSLGGLGGLGGIGGLGGVGGIEGIGGIGGAGIGRW